MNLNKSKTVLVLAGGFGSRLRSEVSDVPKSLAPVNGRPFLDLWLRNLIRQGAKNFIFLLHYKSAQIIDFLQEFTKTTKFSGLTIEYVIEDVPLGTGGAILNAIRVKGLSGSFFVFNSDTWLNDGYSRLVSSDVNSLATTMIDDAGRYGKLSVRRNMIIKFSEKSKSIQKGLINAGAYHLEASIFAEFVEGDYISLERDIFPSLAKTGMLSSVELFDIFIDIGVPQDYYKFCKWAETEKLFEN